MNLKIKTKKGIEELEVKKINERIKSSGIEIIDNYSSHKMEAKKLK